MYTLIILINLWSHSGQPDGTVSAEIGGEFETRSYCQIAAEKVEDKAVFGDYKVDAFCVRAKV